MELYKPFDFLTADECQEVIQYSKTQTLLNSGVSNDRTVNYNHSLIYENNGDVWVKDKATGKKKYREPSHVDDEYRKSRQCPIHDKKYNKKTKTKPAKALRLPFLFRFTIKNIRAP